jgi:thioredoxin-related protein
MTALARGPLRGPAALAVVALAGMGLFAAPLARAESADQQARLSWADDYESALAQARKSGKYVLLDFYTDWCGWCKRLDRDVFAKEEFQVAASRIVGVKVNAEKNRPLAQRFGVTSYPRLFVLDKEGRTLERIKGYVNLQEFTSLVKRVQDGNSEFQRLRAAAADPSNLQAIHSFATFLRETSQLEESIPYWQQVHDIALEQLFAAPESTAHQYFHRRALLNLGEAFAAAGLLDVGKQNLQEVTLTYQGSNEAADALLALAQLEVDRKNAEEANRYLSQLASDYPRTRANRASQALRVKLRSGGAQ